MTLLDLQRAAFLEALGGQAPEPHSPGASRVVEGAALKLGVSRRTAYRWLNQYRLLPEQRSPRTQISRLRSAHPMAEGA